MAEDYKDKRFRDANAPNCAEVVDAVINTANETLEALEDGKITLGEVGIKVFGLIDDWIAAGKDINLVDDEIRAIGWDTALRYVIGDIDDGLAFPVNMANIDKKVEAAVKWVKATIEFWFAMASKE